MHNLCTMHKLCTTYALCTNYAQPMKLCTKVLLCIKHVSKITERNELFGLEAKFRIRILPMYFLCTTIFLFPFELNRIWPYWQFYFDYEQNGIWFWYSFKFEGKQDTRTWNTRKKSLFSARIEESTGRAVQDINIFFISCLRSIYIKYR